MTETVPLRVLIADDEPIAHATIEALVREDADLHVVHVCQDGPSALAALREGGVDLALLDIEMPGLTGLDVIQELGPAAPPAVIFATAYDHFAVQAFDVRAVDYVLKPYDDDRLRAALVRAKTRLAERDAAIVEQAAAIAAKPRRLHGALPEVLVGVEGNRFAPRSRSDFIHRAAVRIRRTVPRSGACRRRTARRQTTLRRADFGCVRFVAGIRMRSSSAAKSDRQSLHLHQKPMARTAAIHRRWRAVD